MALLTAELAAVGLLQASGAASSLQVPWGQLGTWLSTSSVQELAGPVLRVFALALAYWMLASTTLCVLARASRIPGAIRFSSMFALPSVRRVVDGAVAVSLATTSLVGMGSSIAMAAGAPSADVTATPSLSLNSPSSSQPDVSDDQSPTTQLASAGSSAVSDPGVNDAVDTPRPGPDTSAATDNSATDTTGSTSTSTSTTSTSTTSTSTTSVPAPTTTTSTSTSLPPSAITDAPQSDSSFATQAPLIAAVTNGTDDFVATPRLVAPVGDAATPTTPPPSTTTTTTVPPATPATPQQGGAASQQPTTQVLGEQVLQPHVVVYGENLWIISKNALAKASNRPASQFSDSDVRDYWLQVVHANSDNLRSHDPHWIFPGEAINLPAINNSSPAG